MQPTHGWDAKLVVVYQSKAPYLNIDGCYGFYGTQIASHFPSYFNSLISWLRVPDAISGNGSSDPTSSRREASLLSCRAFGPGLFFV